MEQKPWSTAIVILSAVLVCLLAASGDSLWIDEAYSAVYAGQSSLSALWHTIQKIGQSDVQMLGYFVWLFIWEKLLGHSEWALRIACLPFVVGGVTVLWKALPRPKNTVVVTLLLLSPFVWYCINEARPYATQFGGGCAVLAALIPIGRSGLSEGRLWLFAGGLLVLGGASAAGLPWVFAATLALGLLLRRRGWNLTVSASGRLLLVMGVPMVGLFGFYLWNHFTGVRTENAGSLSVFSSAFAVYELLGLAGLGPGRVTLREEHFRALVPFWPMIAPAAAVSVYALVTGLRAIARRLGSRDLLAGLLLVGVATAIPFVLASHSRFRILGRHLTPLVCVIVVVLASGLAALWAKPARWNRGIVLAILVFDLLSLLQLRLAARHRKDDYRGAARWATAALSADKTVWWVADVSGAEYYGVTISLEAGLRRALALRNPAQLPEPPPDVVIMSKPDLFDDRSAVRDFLAQHAYRQTDSLQAFGRWERP